MIYFLLKVVLHADDLSGSVVETSHHTSLHMGWMIGLKMEMSVRVHGLLLTHASKLSSSLLLSRVSI